MPLPRRRNELHWCVWIICKVLTCYLPIIINPLSIFGHACCRRAERWKQLLRSGLLWQSERRTLLRLWWCRKRKTVLCSGEEESYSLDLHWSLHILSMRTSPPNFVSNHKQLSDGGCPCPEGQKKCDAGMCDVIHIYHHWWPFPQLLLSLTAPISSPTLLCISDPWIGMTSYYCAMVCCNIITEETCSYYDKDGNLGQYCALVSTYYYFHVHLCVSLFLWVQHLDASSQQHNTTIGSISSPMEDVVIRIQTSSSSIIYIIISQQTQQFTETVVLLLSTMKMRWQKFSMPCNIYRCKTIDTMHACGLIGRNKTTMMPT